MRVILVLLMTAILLAAVNLLYKPSCDSYVGDYTDSAPPKPPLRGLPQESPRLFPIPPKAPKVFPKHPKAPKAPKIVSARPVRALPAQASFAIRY